MSYLTKEQVNKYWENGFLKVHNFWDKKTIASIQLAMKKIIRNLEPDEIKIFTTNNQTAALDRYFLESGDKIRCFFEEEAINENGNFQRPLERAINKIGHAMHDLDPVFEKASYTNELYQIATDLGLTSPAIAQSQYIFKQPEIGGAVNMHTDSTFITTQPVSCMGAWIALNEATTENGCLSFISGSHRWPLQQFYVRNEQENGTVFQETPLERVEWDSQKLQPVPAVPGDIVLLHGSVVHASTANRSQRSRHAYILHLIDLKCQWLGQNWLQRPPEMPFRCMKDVIRDLK